MLRSSQETKTTFNYVISFKPSVLIDNTVKLAHDNKTTLVDIINLYHIKPESSLHNYLMFTCTPHKKFYAYFIV